jgi:hypothetical protein
LISIQERIIFHIYDGYLGLNVDDISWTLPSGVEYEKAEAEVALLGVSHLWLPLHKPMVPGSFHSPGVAIGYDAERDSLPEL